MLIDKYSSQTNKENKINKILTSFTNLYFKLDSVKQVLAIEK